MLLLLLKEHQTGTRRFDALLKKVNSGLLLNVMLGAVLAMLFDSKLSSRYWGEAIQTANYLQNMTPTKALSPNATPF